MKFERSSTKKVNCYNAAAVYCVQKPPTEHVSGAEKWSGTGRKSGERERGGERVLQM